MAGTTTDAIDRMRRWGEERDWRGWDPYDALNSPFVPALTLGTRAGRRALTQAVKLSPLNLRPLLRIPPERNTKAIGLVASGYARLAAARGDEAAAGEARRWLRWLAGQSTADVGRGWGYHFDVQTRFFAYGRGTPNVIATSFVAHAFLDGAELLDEAEWGEEASRACAFLTARLLDDGARPYFRYLHAERELVHNANVLACSVLARTAAVTGREELLEPARAALTVTLDAQRPDGAWGYAEGEGHGWVDNFHTGYVLEGLSACVHAERAVRPALERGLDYWERNLFLADGTPKYYDNRLLPIDTHNHAQAIETWLAVASWRAGALERAERIAEQLVRDWLEPDGHVSFQRRRWWTSRVPFVRWTTAPAFRALARLELARGEAA
jgi:hypothetical protein